MDTPDSIHAFWFGPDADTTAQTAIIDRFGRFPHRNAALGRESTADEVAFLQQPGSGF